MMPRQRHEIAISGSRTTPPGLGRRRVLAALAAGCATSVWPRAAQATLLRGLPLELLTKHSNTIVVGRALESSSRWLTIGGRKRIVTDTRFAVEATLIPATSAAELTVRTHGGRVGQVGERVHGEPELALHATCMLFLVQAEAVHHVLGMAQGHYPLRDGIGRARRLRASPQLPALVHVERSAVRLLAGRELGAAEAMIRKALGS
jgi:hypothetical protein